MGLADSNHYRRTIAATADHPALEDDATTEICIVGAGLAGLTTALELARAGCGVILLEAHKVAWGASGRNGGFVGPGYAAGHDHIVRHVGKEVASKLHALSIEGMRMVDGNIRDLQMPGVDQVRGILRVSRLPGIDAARSQLRWLKETFDYDADLLPREAVEQRLVSKRYFHAIDDHQSFHFHPLNYALGLAAEITRLGGRIFESSRVEHVQRDGGDYLVRTRNGNVRAKKVVICGGGYTDETFPKLRSSYVPISTYMVASRPSPDLLASAIRTRCAVGDSRRSSDYYRLAEDGTRLLWGGMITTRVNPPDNIAELLKRRIVDTYPQLAALEIEQAWSGRMAYARHLMPQIGQLDDGLWHCTAFGGHGMNTTAIGGRLTAEALLGKSDSYRLFQHFGLRWNGAAIGRAAVQFTYWYYQLRDWKDERSAHHDAGT